MRRYVKNENDTPDEELLRKALHALGSCGWLSINIHNYGYPDYKEYLEDTFADAKEVHDLLRERLVDQ